MNIYVFTHTHRYGSCFLQIVLLFQRLTRFLCSFAYAGMANWFCSREKFRKLKTSQLHSIRKAQIKDYGQEERGERHGIYSTEILLFREVKAKIVSKFENILFLGRKHRSILINLKVSLSWVSFVSSSISQVAKYFTLAEFTHQMPSTHSNDVVAEATTCKHGETTTNYMLK